MSLDDVKAASDLYKASLFNRYSHSVLDKSDNALPNGNTKHSSPTILIDDTDITEKEVYETFASLDATKSQWYRP